MQDTAVEARKSELREAMRIRRKNLSAKQQTIAEKQLDERISLQPCYIQAKHLALYFTNDFEISTNALFLRAQRDGKYCYFPRIEKGLMTFHEHAPGDALTRNSYGIYEPLACAPNIAASDLDVVCLPLVAFDKQGRRLGMGGGYYDRCFANCRSNQASTKGGSGPLLIGLAHACQAVAELPEQHWDVPLDAVVTDEGFIPLK